jgi:hypothetical protein
MNVTEMDLIVRKERNNDLLRQAERERLVNQAKPAAGAGARLLAKVAGWFAAAPAASTHAVDVAGLRQLGA